MYLHYLRVIFDLFYLDFLLNPQYTVAIVLYLANTEEHPNIIATNCHAIH